MTKQNTVYRDEEGNEILDFNPDDYEKYQGSDEDDSVFDSNGNNIDVGADKKQKFSDLKGSSKTDKIFSYKSKVDSLITQGKDIKSKFIKEAGLVETDDAQRLMEEAFSKINLIKNRKTGFLALSERILPNFANKFIQDSALKIDQEIRNQKDITEVSKELFGFIKSNQDDVEHSAVQFVLIKNQMIETLDLLSEEARELESLKDDPELNEIDLFNIERILTLISNNILTFKASLLDINASQNIAMQCISHIDQMLPTIENSLNDSLAINAFLHKIEQLKTSFTTIAKVTSEIQDNNSVSINNAIRTSGDFEDLISNNVNSINKNIESKTKLAIEMKKQGEKQQALGIELRNAIVTANESLDDNANLQVFSSADDVGNFYVPQRIDLNNTLGNKKAKKEVQEENVVVVKKVRK